jgi:hypothetical protein
LILGNVVGVGHKPASGDIAFISLFTTPCSIARFFSVARQQKARQELVCDLLWKNKPIIFENAY